MRLRPTRRMLLQASAGAWIGGAGQAEPKQAAAFVDSVGVNVHLGSEPYASGFDRFCGLISASGICHLRDELRPGNDLARWRRLFDAYGIRSHLLVSPATNTVAEMLDYLAALGSDRVTAIEGQNEGDSDWFMANPAARYDWATTVVAYQREAFAALRGLYPASSLPILSPSVLDWKPADMWLIRRAAPFCDIVALHPYVQHGQEPETADSNASLAWYLRQVRDPFKPGAPVMATEAGYTNLVTPGGAGVSERAAAIYLPRLLLHNFAGGVLRTFLYEFMDGGRDPVDGEHHWGLVRHDGSAKPAYDAIRNLLAALSEPVSSRPARATLPLRVNPVDPPADVRMVSLRRPDGGIVVALWRAIRSWDVARALDRSIPPMTLALAAPAARTAAWLVPNDTGAWNEVRAVDGAIMVPLSDKVVLARFSADGA